MASQTGDLTESEIVNSLVVSVDVYFLPYPNMLRL